MITIKAYLKIIAKGFRTLLGLNHQELMDEAYDSLSQVERERLDGIVELSHK